MPLFGRNYDDEQLCSRAEHAQAEDPLVSAARMGVVSDNGIVVLTGTVGTHREKDHAAEVVRHALEFAQLKYDRIENDIIVAS